MALRNALLLRGKGITRCQEAPKPGKWCQKQPFDPGGVVFVLGGLTKMFGIVYPGSLVGNDESNLLSIFLK